MNNDILNVDFNQIEDFTSGTEELTDIVPPQETVEVDTVETESTETPTETSPKAPTTSTQNSEDNSSVYAALVQEIFEERGLSSQFNLENFSKLEKEKGGAAAVIESINSTIEEYKGSLQEQYDDYVKEYTQLRDMGASPEEAGELINSWESIERLDVSSIDGNEDLAKSVLFSHYKATTKFSDARIEKEIQKKLDYGDLFSDAEEAATELKGIAKERVELTKKELKAQADNAEKQRKENLDKLKTTVKSTKKVWDVELTDPMKDKIIDMMTKPVAQDSKGNALNTIWADMAKDPVDFQMKVAVLKLTGAWENIDKLISKSNKTYNKLEEALKKESSGITKGFNRDFSKSTEEAIQSTEEFFKKFK